MCMLNVHASKGRNENGKHIKYILDDTVYCNDELTTCITGPFYGPSGHTVESHFEFWFFFYFLANWKTTALFFFSKARRIQPHVNYSLGKTSSRKCAYSLIDREKNVPSNFVLVFNSCMRWFCWYFSFTFLFVAPSFVRIVVYLSQTRRTKCQIHAAISAKHLFSINMHIIYLCDAYQTCWRSLFRRNGSKTLFFFIFCTIFILNGMSDSMLSCGAHCLHSGSFHFSYRFYE